MRFTNAHSSSGVCTPSRYAMLEGRYHWRKFHGIVNSFDPPILDSEKTTLAELLKKKGYATACIGKWHLGWDWEAIKAEERSDGGASSAMDGVALALPALMRAQKLQKRAARTGFDWPDVMGAVEKIGEEVEELLEAENEAERIDEAGAGDIVGFAERA